MIQLRENSVFDNGGRRMCFVHPDDPGKCIKTLNASGNPVARRQKAPWYKRLRPLYFFDDNARELASFRTLERKGAEEVWNHFPVCYGMMETSCGSGIVTDLIRDVNGAVSKSLREYVKTFGKTPELSAALDRFFNLLVRERVITRDLLDHNLVVQQNSTETVSVYMVDGFGSSEMVPLSSWIPAFGKRKILRKIERFRRRYGLGRPSGGESPARRS
jgi:hypothetical protein